MHRVAWWSISFPFWSSMNKMTSDGFRIHEAKTPAEVQHLADHLATLGKWKAHTSVFSPCPRSV